MTPAPTVPNTLAPSTFASDMDAFLAWMAIHAVELEQAASAYGQSITATSTTSLTVATGAQPLAIGTDKGFVPGMAISVAYTTTPTTRMLGNVTSYDPLTGALVVNVTSVTGSGTYAAWSIGPAASVSFDGQTFTDLRLAGKITETVYALSGTVIDPANGSIQTKTLAANTTFTSTIAPGESVALHISAGAYTVVWPTTSWLWGGAPALSATGWSVVVLYNVGGTLFGVFAGAT